jgi:hypothetical protein
MVEPESPAISLIILDFMIFGEFLPVFPQSFFY